MLRLTKQDQPVAADEVQPAAAGLGGEEEGELGEGWVVEVLDLHSMTTARPQHEQAGRGTVYHWWGMLADAAALAPFPPKLLQVALTPTTELHSPACFAS